MTTVILWKYHYYENHSSPRAAHTHLFQKRKRSLILILDLPFSVKYLLDQKEFLTSQSRFLTYILYADNLSVMKLWLVILLRPVRNYIFNFQGT